MKFTKFELFPIKQELSFSLDKLQGKMQSTSGSIWASSISYLIK